MTTPAAFPPTAGNAVSTATLRRISTRLIPLLFVCYIVAWLDRVNVGFAALQMNEALKFSPVVFSLGSSVFFVGYCLFEIPSNVILHRVGARRWIARIMVSWGLLSAAMMFVRTPTSFYVLRFLLGVAEAGFFPGIIYYLGLWYPREQRARAIAGFMTAIPVSGVVGGSVSGVLLGLDGLQGLAGWQWLFLLEGLPAVILGLVVYFYLDDGPEHARWLAPAERDSLKATLTSEHAAGGPADRIDTWAAVTNPTVLVLGITFLLVVIGFYGYTIWAPLVIRSLTGFSNLGVGFVAASFSAVAIVVMLLNGAHSDRTGERPIHVAIPNLIMGAGFIGSALSHNPVLALLSLGLVPIAHTAAVGPLWSMPATFLKGEAAAAGIACIATIANAGGIIGPLLIGFLKERTGTHTLAFLILGTFAIASALTALQLRRAAVLTPSRPAARMSGSD